MCVRATARHSNANSGSRSRYQPSYDSGDSRRSPRDQSPGRYNDPRDEYRGGSGRGVERRRSISDSRGNHNAFASNREPFREPTNRESSRDFSTREPPRGPKGLIDAPTGPRASNYQPEFRSDFSFRGDFRGERGGRGRGRGWRDDSRDRGREGDRDYRDRRDDRAPAPFRDDRGGRERWPRENNFRGGRRPSSPQGRGRSPNYGPRDTRDVPPALDIDRTRRGSRDPPLSGGSPASDSMPYRGYGRGRGRGRGRGGFYDDHRPQGRSRSPEPGWNRRTQPSATPPPQVPAFGSTSSTTAPAVKPPTSPAAMLTGVISGLVPGVAVPTAPRSLVANAQNPRSRHHTGSATWINPQLKGPSQSIESGRSESNGRAQQNGGLNSPKRSAYDMDANVSPQSRQRSSPEPQNAEALGTVPKNNVEAATSRSTSRRKPVIGRRPPKAPLSVLPDIEDNSSSDSGDDLGDDYFEDEIAKIKNQIAELSDENPLAMPPETSLVFLGPFLDSNIEDLAATSESALLGMCSGPELQQPQPILDSTLVSPTSVSKSISEASRTHRRTPTPVPASLDKIDVNGTDPLAIIPVSAKAEDVPNPPRAVAPDDSLDADFEVDDIEEPAGPMAGECRPAINGSSRNIVPMLKEVDEMDCSKDDSKVENLETLEAVRKYMKTPPLSDLPNFNTKPWHQDNDFLRTLAPQPEVEARIKRNLEETAIRRHKEQDEERHRWRDRYLDYRQWTDFSPEDAPVHSRDRFEKSRTEAAAVAAAPNSSSVPTAGAKAEGSRRMGRFATEHDFERVLRESEQEAKEKKDVEERAARAKTASAKEATIPDMAWDDEEWNARKFIDRTHIVPFERSFARLEMSEPIDNFTEDENQIFETAYLEFPKQWGKIADALSGRDYKACIQHYYLVKHSSNIKEKLKKQPKRRKGRRKAAGNPKSNAMTDLGLTIRDEGEDAADAENGERRRPRRAAAPTWSFETPASESEVASPAPTPGRKSAAAQKPDTGADAPAPKTRKTKVPREKAVKQAKNSQLLAAAPAAMNRRAESPATPATAPDWKIRRESAGPGASPGVGPGPGPAGGAAVGPPAGPNRFPPQYDGTGQIPTQFPSPFATPVDRPSPLMNVNFELMGQSYPTQERLDSAPPMGFDSQQDRRNIQQTSSYWSVPEQSDFPALLKHFGTDWHGIAKHMTSKTHIMVYTTVFQQWLAVPSDSNKSRRVANIQTQVKNFYQRQVDTMGKREWEEYARGADEKRARGEPVGPLPNPTIAPKRRYDLTPSTNGRPGSAMEGSEDLTPLGSTSIPSQLSSPQPPTSVSSRFPPLAQAGPVSQIQPATPISVLSKHQSPQQTQHQTQQGPAETSNQQPGHVPAQPPVPMQQGMQHTVSQVAHQPIQQAIRQAPISSQQVQPIQPIRAPRGSGPALGYFSTDTSSRPGQAETLSQRSLMAAQEAQLERQAALRVEREQTLQREQAAMQREQQIAIQREQQQQAMQREMNQREANLRETGLRETHIQREAALRETHNQREAALREQAMHREQARQQEARQQEAVLREQALQREQSQALALQQRERVEREQQQQQQALQRERQFHLKQEIEMPNLRQYEAYNSPTVRNGNSSQSRPEIAKSVMPPAPEPRRPVQQQYQPRNSVRNLLSDNGQVATRDIKSTPSPALPRAPMSAPPTSHEQYTPPSSQAAPLAASRQEVRKTVSVMSLLNDEPSEPRPTPTKRVSDVSSSSLQPSRTPPPPQHSLQASRYSTHTPSQSQGSQHMQQHIPTPQPPQQSASQNQHSYAQPTPQPMHQHSSSIGHTRSYTPNSFERTYPSSQAQQQQLYSQAPRQSLPPQSQNVRREASISDMHGITGGYSRSSGPAQSRLKESPYSATPPPQAPQPVRPSAASPIDMQPADRDYYQPRPAQSQYMGQQQQSSAAGSPQLGPTYHSQGQPPPPQPSHRPYTYGSMQGQPHTASPQPQFAAQHQVHRSRHNSFDGRPPHMASTSAPTTQQTSQQGYSQAPPYQSYTSQNHNREETRFANPFDRQRRMEDEAYHRRMQDEQRRMDERR